MDDSWRHGLHVADQPHRKYLKLFYLLLCMQVTGEEGAALLAWQQLYSLLIVQEFGDTHMPQGYSCYVERLFILQHTALCGLRWCPSTVATVLQQSSIM